MEIKLSDRLKQRDQIEIRAAGEGAIALNLNDENYYSLDSIAYTIYQQLISGSTVNQIITHLTDEFEVSQEELKKDILELAQELVDSQFLEVVSD